MKTLKLPTKQLDLRISNSVNTRPAQSATFEGTFVDVARAQPQARLAPQREPGEARGVHAASVTAAAARRSHTRTGGSGLDTFHFVAAPNGVGGARSSPERSSSTTQPRPTLAISHATIMAPSLTKSPAGGRSKSSLSTVGGRGHGLSLSPSPSPVPGPSPERHQPPPSGAEGVFGTATSPTHVSAQRQVHHLRRIEDVAEDRLAHVGDDGDDSPAHEAVASIGRMLLQHSPHRSGLGSLSPTKAPHHLPGLASPITSERRGPSGKERLDDMRIAEIRQDAMLQAAAINAASYTNRRAAQLLANARGTAPAAPTASFGGVDGLLTAAEHEALQGLLNKHALRQARELDVNTATPEHHVQ